MKIQSKAVFYADDTLSDGVVIFTGDGATYGDVLGVVVSKVIDFTDVTNISTGQDSEENFLMILELTNKKVEINLAKVTNQDTWENDADGLQVAIHDVLSWKKKSSVDSSQPEEFTGPVKIRPGEIQSPWIPGFIQTDGPEGNYFNVSGEITDYEPNAAYFQLNIGSDGSFLLAKNIFNGGGTEYVVDETNLSAGDVISWNGLTFTILLIPEEFVGYDTIIRPIAPYSELSMGSDLELVISGSIDTSREGINIDELPDEGFLLYVAYSSQYGWGVGDDSSLFYDQTPLSEGPFFGYSFDVSGNPIDGDQFLVLIFKPNPEYTTTLTDALQIIKEIEGVDTVIFSIDKDGNIAPAPTASSNTLLYKAYATSKDSVIQTPGSSLVIGQPYLIHYVETGDDFSNVGFVSAGEIFIAIETDPNDWLNGTEVTDILLSSPDVIIMPSTTLTGVTLEFYYSGKFKIKSDAKFKTGKTFVEVGNPNNSISSFELLSESEILVSIKDPTSLNYNPVGTNIPIRIEVDA